MNTILGARIRSLREAKGFTEDQVAGKMKWSKQKYARLEKGLLDISYASIVTIAQVLDVEMEEITSSVNNIQQSFKEISSSAQDKFEYVNEMIDLFIAHRKLYNSIERSR